MSYGEPAPIAARLVRAAIFAALAFVGATLIGGVNWQTRGPSLASSSSLEASPMDTPPGDRDLHRGRGGRGRDRQYRLSTLRTSSPPTMPGEADGVVPAGLTVFGHDVPAVANLNPDLLAAVRQAAADAGRDGVRIVVNSGWRSPAYQRHLLHAAVSKYGSTGKATQWVARPDKSSHVSGDAVDVGPTRATTWLSRHGAEYGVCRIYRNEPWHYELRPEAIDDGCPAMYADPRHDPRMQQ